MSKYKLDVKKLIDHCCGLHAVQSRTQTDKIHALAAELNKEKLCRMKVKSIKKWIERDSIPTDQLINLTLLALKHGKNLKLNDFLIKRENSELKALLGI